ncbi:unnamed protein product [Rhizoctonia solani]|uniref:Uncharacterized protein n=1 Tax=Rhizoctonia solani TaxID=456999 RepID=A0A8H3B4B0_9AGAM|nr:unnamed protein product [Rhizoctonia solani]
MRIQEPSDQTSEDAHQEADLLRPEPPRYTSNMVSDLPGMPEALPLYSGGPSTPVTHEIFTTSESDDDLVNSATTTPGQNQPVVINYEHTREPSVSAGNLVEDQGSNGIVEKIIIEQKSLSKIINLLQPGSYKSVSNIDFKSLDNLVIKPIGIYGDQTEIFKYLQNAGCLDRDSESHIFKHDSQGGRVTALRSGLYLTMNREEMIMNQDTSKMCYVFYWPEEATWDDKAAAFSSTIRRNRETFMRYLTKLCDQTLALVSLSQARNFVWEANTQDRVIPEHQRSDDAESRLEEFEVRELDEEEEAAISSAGFQISARSAFSTRRDRVLTQTDLVTGEEKIGLMTQVTEKARTEASSYDRQLSQMALRDIILPRDGQPQLVLGDLSEDSLDILGSNGLRDRYPDIFQEYSKSKEELEHNLFLESKSGEMKIDEEISHERSVLAQEIRLMIYEKYNTLYPSLPPPQPKLDYGAEMGALIRAQYDDFGLDQVNRTIEKHKITYIRNAEFRTLKSNWLCFQTRINENKDSSEVDLEEPDSKIRNESSDNSEEEPSLKPVGFLGKVARYALEKVGRTVGQGSRKAADRINDPDFISRLSEWEKHSSHLAELTKPIYDSLRKDVEAFADKTISSHLDRVMNTGKRARHKVIQREVIEAGYEDYLRYFLIMANLNPGVQTSYDLTQSQSKVIIMVIILKQPTAGIVAKD